VYSRKGEGGENRGEEDVIRKALNNIERKIQYQKAEKVTAFCVLNYSGWICPLYQLACRTKRRGSSRSY